MRSKIESLLDGNSRKKIVEYGKKHKDLIIKTIRYIDDKSMDANLLEVILDIDQKSAETLFNFLINENIGISRIETQKTKDFIEALEKAKKHNEALLKKLKSGIVFPIKDDNMIELIKDSLFFYKNTLKHYRSEKNLEKNLTFYYLCSDAIHKFLNFIGEKYTHDEALKELKKWKEKLDLQIITHDRYKNEKDRLIKFIDKEC